MKTLYCTSCAGLVTSFEHTCEAVNLATIPSGSSQWLAWRMGGIGGSDAPAVMNASPFKDRMTLWLEKTGRVKPPRRNAAMQRGLDLESFARLEYERMTGIPMPATRGKHPEHDFIRVNADGANRDARRALEIKAPGKKDHDIARKGLIPRHYIPQLVHTLLVLDLPVIDYFSFKGLPPLPTGAVPIFPELTRGQGIIIAFKRNAKLEKQLLIEEKAFWKCIEDDVPPDRKPITEPPRKSQGIFKVRKR